MIRWLIAGGVWLVVATSPLAAGDSVFAAGMLARMHAAMPDVELHISADDPMVIEMKDQGDWNDGEFDLHRVHAFCSRLTAEECDLFLDDYVSVLSAAPPEPIVENLRVVVRQAAYLASLREKLPRDEQPLSRQIGDDLFVLLAFVDDKAIAFARPEQLRSLGLGGAAMWRLGMEQTWAMLPELPRDVDFAEHVVGIEDYDLLPSLLADIRSWRDIARLAGPDLFVTASSDMAMWIGVMPDGPGLEAFKQVVRADCESQARCVSPNVYRFREGRWVIAD